MSEGEESSHQSPPVRLKSVLEFRHSLAIVVGTVIGSGIFFKQNVLAQSLGRLDWILAVWLGGGLLAAMGALIYAELGTMMPESGGAYVYIREAYGRFWAFLLGWTTLFFSRPAASAALAVAAAVLMGCQGALIPLAAVLLLASLGAVNVLGTRSSGQFQQWAFWFKVGGLLLLIVLPLLFAPTETQLSSYHTVDNPAWGGAFLAVLWAYDGWYNVVSVSEEVKDPAHSLPRALVGGVALVTVLYLLVNLSIHQVLSMESLADSQQPAADMVEALLGPEGAAILRALLLISVIGTLNAGILCAPRLFFAMARDGLMPSKLAEVHPRFGTPAVAVVIYCLWATLLIILAESLRGKTNLFDLLTNYVILGVLLFSCMTVLSLVVLRHSQPDRKRPYRCWGYPLTPLLFLLSLVWLIGLNLWESPLTSLAGLGLIALGVPLYWSTRRHHQRGTS